MAARTTPNMKRRAVTPCRGVGSVLDGDMSEILNYGSCILYPQSSIARFIGSVSTSGPPGTVWSYR